LHLKYQLTGCVKPSFKYLTAWARVSLPHRKALNQELGGKLWDWCEEQIKDMKVKE
jgi:hypothetical protein